MEEELPINTYETVIISKPEADPKHLAKVHDICALGTMPYKMKEDNLGVKKLAYPIKEVYTEGTYIIYTWMGGPDQVTEIERLLRVDDDVLKFITVRKGDDKVFEIKWEDATSQDEIKSEQDDYDPNTQVDAYDVLLGFAEYKK